MDKFALLLIVGVFNILSLTLGASQCMYVTLCGSVEVTQVLG